MFALIIAGVIIGILASFAYIKITKKTDLLPAMKFVNPNYDEKSKKADDN